MIARITKWAPWVIVLIAVAAALYSWYRPHGQSVPTQQYSPAPEIKKAEDVKRVIVEVRQVQALDKKGISGKLNLPAAIAKDDTKQVTATAAVEVDPDKGKTDVVSVLDTQTGKTEIITKQERPSLIAFENQKEIGIRYGLSTGAAGHQAELYGRWTFVRVGALYGALYGEINTRPESKAMIELSYRF